MNHLYSLLLKRFLTSVFLISYFSILAQVGINTQNPSATLHVKFDNTNSINNTVPPGIIAPNLTLNELDDYMSLYDAPQKGAFIYITEIDTNLTNKFQFTNITSRGYYFFDGMVWNVFAKPSSETIFENTEPWFSTETNLGATLNSENIYHLAQVGVGKNGPIDINAQLEITSTSKGLIIPRLTLSERGTITSPTTSMMIWNTDEQCFNFYKGPDQGWKSICESPTVAEFSIINCETSVIGGTYVVGKLVDNNNYILLNIDVTQKGTYSIEATTDVGLYFQKSGTFPAPGIYTIAIPAYGSPTDDGNNKIAKISINGNPPICNIIIPIIAPATVSYNIVNSSTDIHAEDLTKEIPSYGKAITLNINVTTTGTTNLTAKDNSGLNITYVAYNVILDQIGLKTVILYSTGGTVPSTFSNNTLEFKLTGLGLKPDGGIDFPITVINPAPTIAEANCDKIIVNGNYVAGKELTSSNSLTVTANVTKLGTYEFISENVAANITFKASGRFTKTGVQTFTAFASKINPSNPVGPILGYSLTSTFNNISFCNYDLNIIYPTTNVLLYSQNTQYIKQALTPGSISGRDTNNFSPNGIFKSENINVIYDATSWTLTSASLLNYINNQNVQIIIIPQGVIIPLDTQQVLANFIKKRKGQVIFSSVGDVTQTAQVKGIIDILYPGSATINTNNFGSQLFNATIFPTDNSNPYLKGVFGEVERRYYLFHNYNITPDIVLNSGSTPLKSLVNLPAAANVTARDAFVYSDTPGLFIIPGDRFCLGNPNTLYGNYWPIQANTAIYNAYAYSGTSTTSNRYPLITLNSGMIVNWVLFGNIMAEYIKYSYQNYNKDVIIDTNP